MTNKFNEELLDILVCPLTRSKLRVEGDYLVAEKGGLKYPVKDGIPILLSDKAELPEGIVSLDEFKVKFKEFIPDNHKQIDD